jgi:GAF domain-containing protein
LRIRDDKTKNLKVKAIEASDPRLLEGRKDDDREFGKGFVWKAVENREEIIVPEINEKIDCFINKEWIKKQEFKTYACFPLVTKKDVFGTLSLFVGYKYNFHESCQTFMKNVTSQLASFEENLRLAKIVSLFQDEENFLKEKEQRIKLIHDNYQISKKAIESKYKVEIEEKNDQLKEKNDQIEFLREINVNLSKNSIHVNIT